MGKLLKIDKEIRVYLKKRYREMRREIEQYIRDKIPFKKLSKGSQQILRQLGIYYEKTPPRSYK